jgi:hypothetical protein
MRIAHPANGIMEAAWADRVRVSRKMLPLSAPYDGRVRVVAYLVGAVPVAAGLLIAIVGFLGLRERLARNRFFGVRTSATLCSEQAFRVGNRVAGRPAMMGGLVGIVGGSAGYLMPGTGGLLTGAMIGLVGMLAVTLAAGVLGHRAALVAAEPEPAVPAGCGGCACGNCGRSVGANVGANVLGHRAR